MKGIVLATALGVFAVSTASPASAGKTACTRENIAKTEARLESMQNNRAKRAMMKEMGLVNSDMSRGNTRSACAHYMRAQRTMNDPHSAMILD